MAKMLEAVKEQVENMTCDQLNEYYHLMGCPREIEPLLARKMDENHKSYVMKDVAEFLRNKQGQVTTILIHCQDSTMNSYEKTISDRIDAEYGESVPIFRISDKDSTGMCSN